MNIRTLCLGILSYKEATGYEIKKMVEEGMFNHFIDASYGSIYPALTQMLAEGLLSVRAEEQAGKPDKKIYTITQSGRVALSAALDVLPRPDKFKSEFLFQMLMINHLSGERLAAIYDSRLGELNEELQRIKSCHSAESSNLGQRFVNGYGQAVVGAAVKYLEEQRAAIIAEAARRTAEAAE